MCLIMRLFLLRHLSIEGKKSFLERVGKSTLFG